jgi:lipoprotein NlpI
VAIAVAGFVVYKELNPSRKVEQVRYYGARVVAAGAQVNGQTARFILDTGSDTLRITQEAADHLGVKSQPLRSGATFSLTDPVYLTLDGATFMVPLGVEEHGDKTEAGYISWPAIRDNILVFNSVKHEISAVAELPPETAGWTKLKVRHADILEIELPLIDGKTGTVVVDTGSSNGLSLPAAQWKEWRAAHPQATIIDRHFIGPQIGTGTTEEAWADKVQFGSLTFSDVPVREAPPLEAKGINNFVGLIGLYTLTRMDLVLDAKNDTAYIHPHDPPGPPYPPFKRQELDETATGLSPNWTLDRSVQPDLAAILLQTAQLKYNTRDGQNALNEFNHVIELYPQYADAYISRGLAKISLNDWDGARADFSHSIELNPQHAYMCYYYRAVEKEAQGDFESALADYTQEVELHSTAEYAAILRRQLLRLRLHRSGENFSQTIADWNNPWDKALGQFITGKFAEAELLAAAMKGSARSVASQQCAANFYIGTLRLINGDPTGARDYWQKASSAKITAFTPTQFSARAELVRLDTAAK